MQFFIDTNLYYIKTNLQLRKGFIFEDNENLQQLEEVILRFPTYLISHYNYENHVFNVIKYFFFFNDFHQNFEYPTDC